MEFAVIWKAFVEYGLLGILCVVEMLAIVRLWRDNNALRDRYEAKAEKSAEKIAILSARANAAADLLEQRRRARRSSESDVGDNR
jgi:hypothetical protein